MMARYRMKGLAAKFSTDTMVDGRPTNIENLGQDGELDIDS